MMLLMEPGQRGATGSEGGLVLDNMTKQDEVLKAVEEPAMGPWRRALGVEEHPRQGRSVEVDKA